MLDCPMEGCGERFQTFHDEHALSTLVTHLRREHPGVYSDLKMLLCGTSND